MLLVMLVSLSYSATEQKNIKRIVEDTTVVGLFPDLIDKQVGFALQDSVMVLRYNDTVYTMPFYGTDTTYLTEVVIDSLDSLNFRENNTPPTEGQIRYNAEKTLRVGTDTGVRLELGRTLSSRFIAQEPIQKGQVIYADTSDIIGTVGTSLATGDSYNKNWVLGVAGNSANTGEIVEFVQKGVVEGVNTSALTPLVPLYICDTPGVLIDTRPLFPCKPYIIGTIVVQDSTNGVIGVNIQTDPYDVTYDGCAIERHDISLRLGIGVDSGKVFVDVEKVGGGDLPLQLSSSTRLLNCTSGAAPDGKATVEILPGTNTLPASYIIYADISGDTATLKATTTYPPQPFVWLGYYSISDYDYTAANGPVSSRRITTAKSHDERGRISYIMERMSVMPVEWWSGVTPTATIDAVPTPDVLDLSILAGIVYQNHRQEFPDLTVSTDSIYVANGPGGAGVSNLAGFANLTELCGYTSVDEARNTSARGHLYIFGSINRTTGECKLYCNLPSELYGGNDGSAYYDYDGTAVNVSPEWLRLTSFAIAQIPYDISSGGNVVNFINPTGTDEIINKLGVPMGTTGGSTGGGGAFVPNLSQVLTEGNDGGGQEIINIAATRYTNAGGGVRIQDTAGIDAVVVNTDVNNITTIGSNTTGAKTIIRSDVGSVIYVAPTGQVSIGTEDTSCLLSAKKPGAQSVCFGSTTASFAQLLVGGRRKLVDEIVGAIAIVGDNDLDLEIQYSKLFSQIKNPADGSESSETYLSQYIGGALTEVMRFLQDKNLQLTGVTPTIITSGPNNVATTKEWVNTEAFSLSFKFSREGFDGTYGGGTATIPYTAFTEDGATLNAGDGVRATEDVKITAVTFQFQTQSADATAYYRINGGAWITLGTVLSVNKFATFSPASLLITAGQDVEFGFSAASGSSFIAPTVTTVARNQF